MRAPLDSQRTAECLLQQRDALRALGRRLLDDGTGDDLVQDTYVAAVQGRAPRGSLVAWLSAIGRRLALLTRRRSERRRAREQRALCREPEPSAADAAATAELVQRVANAVHALPEPYRTVLVLRFWHDLPPRAIAARLGVPVNTVQSQLQRALGRLRERLDERDGRAAWVSPFASFVRAERVLVAGGAAGVIMGTKANVVVAVGLLAAVSWVVVAREVPADAPPAPSEPPRAVTGAGTGGARAPAVRAVAHEPATSIRGRCVAEVDGAPVAGCRVVLASEATVAPPQRPQVLVADDQGRFAATAPTAAPLRLFAGIEHLVAVERRWASLPPGTLEIGDIVLPRGARIVGVVRDEAGNGVGDVGLELSPAERGDASAAFVPCAPVLVSSRADGVLVGAFGVLAPGEWRLAVRSSEVVLRSSARVDVGAGQTQIDLVVVVARLADQPSITGSVVDERGAPVAGLSLAASDGSTARTGDGGVFTLPRRSANTAPVRLRLSPHEACSLQTPDAEYAWGSRDQRVVVSQPAGLWLQVVHAGSGEPLTDYGVWLVPLAAGEWTRGLRDMGHHEGGRLRMRDVRAGRYRVVVQPADTALVPSEPATMELAGDATLRVEVERACTRVVEVRTANGEPVAGSRVDLFRQEGDGELRPALIQPREHAHVLIQHPAAFVVLGAATTGADGRARLLAPARGLLGLRAQGAHVPAIVQPLPPFAEGAPIVVTVERGASLRGRLAPASVLRDLLPPRDDWQRGTVFGAFGDPARPWPTLALSAVAPAQRMLPERLWRGQPGFAIGDDGAFAIDGIPAGDWRIELEFGVGGAWHLRPLGTVARLADGEVREVAFDVGAFAPGELRATVTLDGEPVANREVRFAGGCLRTDARGVVVARVLPGQHHLSLRLDASVGSDVFSDEPIAIAVGGVAERTVALVRRQLRVRVLRADGSPAGGESFAIGEGGETAATDANGWLQVDPAPPWPFRLCEPPAAGRGVVPLTIPLQMPLDRRHAECTVALPK